VEVIVDDLAYFFPSFYIIMDTYYELSNKLIKRFKHEKKVVFYASMVKPQIKKKFWSL
jgi:hypothetical protein